MDGSVRSGGVLKKKSSSGCLIIKKKVENRNPGGGLSENKRPRLVAGDCGVSDEDDSLEFGRRKVNGKRLHYGSVEYARSELEDRQYDRNDRGIVMSGGRKRNRLDSYESDAYDEFEGRRIRNAYVGGRVKMVGLSDDDNSKEFGVGPSRRNLVVDKRKRNAYYDGCSSGRSKGGEYDGLRSKGFETLEEDESHMPVSLLRLKYQENADEPIRLQGKNGVLKVMVNKNKRMDLHSHHRKYDPREVEERANFRSENVVKKDLSPQFPVYQDLKAPQIRGSMVSKEKIEVKLEKVKPILSKNIKTRESEISSMSKGIIKVRELEEDGTDTALQLAPPGLQACSLKKVAKRREERTLSENVTPVKGKEVKEGADGKAKRCGSTEKQILREKIRGMLIESGWTIDYRPRRNRDYLDAVYINPNGTAYWSIIKAYDALKKQLEEDNIRSKLDVASPSFAPLSEDLINKLTRQTKKKIEEEMRRKRKEVGGATKSVKKSAARDAGGSSDSDHNENIPTSRMKQNYKLNQDNGGDSPKRKPRKVKAEKASIASNSNTLQGRTSKVIGRCTLLVRGENSESDGYVPYSGKRTVLGWLIDSGTTQLSEKVQYMNRKRTRVMLEGWITRDGIHCGCCSKILTVYKFELHAGSKLRQPFQNIFLESGASLLQCQIDAWNRQEEAARRDFYTVGVDGDDSDDDTCGICGDGGALICCDSCPSTFHQICLGIQMLPSGDWHCPNCICKFCGDASGNADEENDATADEFTRCNFCEKKYHKSCSEEVYALPISSNGASFCGLKCQELYDHLQMILGVKHELESGFSWSLIQRTDVSDTLNRGFHHRVECNSKLAVALSVMDECFLPINDRRSGIPIIHNVVYNCGSNFNRLNYRGFYMAILERGDEIVSAASIRIRGPRLAEMPFIATREIYRRQGMCRRLLSAIETELRSLKIEHLIIPAISEHMNTWTTAFGFHRLEDVLRSEIKSMNMLVFPGTDMLQKQLAKQETSDGKKVSEPNQNQPRLPVLVEKSDPDSSMECDKQTSNDSGVCRDTKSDDEFDDNSADSVSESDILLTSKKTNAANVELENKKEQPSVEMDIYVEVTEDDIVERINKNQNPPLIPTFPNSGESISSIKDEICHKSIHQVQNDQFDLVSVAPLISSSEVLDENRAPTENHTELQNGADE